MMAQLTNVVRPIYRVASLVTQYIARKCFPGSPLLLATLSFIMASAPANGQATPNPPGQLCVEELGNCDSPVATTTASKKWNPGHYIKPQGNHAQANQEQFLSSVTNQLAKAEDSPEIRGALITYSWGMIEPTLGSYDFEPIYRHLDYLSSRGLKAIISINIKCFGTDCASLAPADLAGEVYVTP